MLVMAAVPLVVSAAAIGSPALGRSACSSARATDSPVASANTGKDHPIAGTKPAPRLLDMHTP